MTNLVDVLVERTPDREHPQLASGDTVKSTSESLRVIGNVSRFSKVLSFGYGGGGNEANFTVRRIASHGVGVERTFLLKSPRVEKIEVVRRAKVRRAQLYFPTRSSW